MFRIISYALLIRIIVAFTTALSILIYAILDNFWPGTSILKLLSITSLVGTFLVLAVSVGFVSRKIWSVLSYFDASLFPDLNGTWEGEIAFGDSVLTARAVIRQTLGHTQIDLHTPTSKSITLESTPVTEGGQAKLYYVHRVTPKNPDWQSYTGSTLFDVRKGTDSSGKTIELSGAYYTDRKTNGRVSLRQTSNDSNRDVSFY